MPQIQAFLDFWPTDIRLAVEVRHLDFFEPPHATKLNILLSHYNVARVMMDTCPIRVGSTKEQQILQARERKPNLPLHITTTTDFAFVRYIGHPRMEENGPFLETWAQQCEQWLKQRITLYVFCHCPFEEHSPHICAELYRRVTTLFPLPPLPWKPHGRDTEPEQYRLF